MLSKNLQSRFQPPSRCITAGAEQQIAGRLDRLLQQEALAVVEPDVAEALVGRRARAVVGVGRRREPALVDAAAMAAERIEIVGVQLAAAAGNHEGARHPARLEPQDAAAGVDRILTVARSGIASCRESGRVD